MTMVLRPSLLASVLDAEEQDDYTSGDCWALAEELGRLSGLPLYVVSVTNVQSESSIDWTKIYWCHVAVRVGDLYLDAHGLSTETELLMRWFEYGDLIRVPSREAFNDLTSEFTLQFRSRVEIRGAAQRLIEAVKASNISLECSEVSSTF